MNTRVLPLLLAVVAFGVLGTSAHAQVPWYRPFGPYAYPPQPYGAGYYGGGYSPVEGYQRGFADVVRSSGEAAERFSRARINNEEARTKYLDNKLKWTEIYWQRKRLGEAQIARDHAEDRARRERWMAANRDRKPEILLPSQYDPRTGYIDWPETLQDSTYSDYRQQIEEELDILASSGTSGSMSKVRTLARQMQGLLKERIREMSPNEYIGAHKFLDRLVNQMARAQAETT